MIVGQTAASSAAYSTIRFDSLGAVNIPNSMYLLLRPLFGQSCFSCWSEAGPVDEK